MGRLSESRFGRIFNRNASKSAQIADHSGHAFGFERLEGRQMLANVVWDGGPAGTGTDFNTAANWVGDVLPTAADVAVINTAGSTITVAASRTVLQVESSRAIQLNSGTLTTTGTSTMTASLNMAGGTLSGGTWNFSAGNAVHALSGGGTITNVTIGGELLLDTASASVLISGTTTFTAARLTTSNAALAIAPGYTLNSLISVEGAASGIRNINLATGGVGTVTIAASGIIRLASGAGGGLTINNSSAATLVNNGLISAEASGQTLTIQNSTFTNNSTLSVNNGTLRINATNWTNPGTLSGTGGIINLDGNWNTTAGAGTLNTSGATVNIAGTITNTGATLTLNAAAGSWNISGGTVNGGTITLAGTTLRGTTNVGTLASVTVNGEILLNTASASVAISGTTSFTTARLSAGSTTLYMAPGTVMNSTIIAEGVATGARGITLAYGGAGTVTFGPSAVVQLAAGTGAGLNFNNSSTATLVNNGLISAEAAGQTLLINNTTLTNNGTLRVTAGTLRINATSWTNPGTINATGGIVQLDGTMNAAAGIGTFTTSAATVNVAGTITNTGNTITLNATTGSWNVVGGAIVNGSMVLTAGTVIRGSNSIGTLNNVAITGEIILDTANFGIVLSGATTFTAARLTASGTNLYLAPGATLNSLVQAEGATSGTRSLTLAYGGVGTVTFGPSAVVRLAAGSGGGLTFGNSSVATLINNGLISAEASGQTLLINNSNLTNNGTMRVTAGTLRINNTSWSNNGTINGTGGTLQLDGTLNAAAGIGTFTTAASVVNLAGTINNGGNTILLDATTGSWNMFGGTIVGGTMNFADGTSLRATTSNGTLNGLTMNGEILLNTASANITIAGATTFTAARLTAANTTLYMAPGATLNSLVVAEGGATGVRNVTLAFGGAGTVTFGPSAIVRLAAACGGGLNFNNSSVATLINNGLITAEATGQILTINNSTVTNNGTMRVTAGTLRISPTNWSNAGTINGTGGVVALEGTLDATAGIGTFTTSAATVNVVGTITNTGNTITLNATTGNWNMSGGTILNGTLTFSGSTLRPTTSNGTLNGVTVNGEVVFTTVNSDLTLSGATTVTAVRMTLASSLDLAPGFTLNFPVFAEGAATGVRSVVLAFGGAGTVTVSPSGSIRLMPGTGGGLNINNSSVANLVNNGLLSAEATGQTFTINNSTMANAGTIQALAGTMNISNNFTNTGLLSGTTGTLIITGTLDNTGATQTINAAAGTWRLQGGTISNGTINISGGFFKTTTSGGTLNNVTINGDITVDTGSITVTGTTTFVTAHLQANGSSLNLAPGYVLSSTVLVEGAGTGLRTIAHAYGGAGTNTYTASAVVRVVSGAGGGLNLANSSVAILVNNGLISSESSGQSINITVSTFTNNGTIRTMNGGNMSISMNPWSNAASIDLQSGTLTVSDFTNSGTINLGAGGLLNVNGNVGLTLTSSSVVNSFINGTANNQFGRIVVTAGNAALGGTLNIAMVGAFQPPIVSTFNIVTVNQTTRSITSPFTTITMPPPGVDGKNFMFNDSRHIQFAFSSLADFNSDTIVDFFDYLDFVQAFSTNDPTADFNLDQSIDFFDYLDFLQIFSRF